MTDLVTRLRTACSPESPLGKLCSEAADIILSLRRELAESQAAHADCIKRNIGLAGALSKEGME